MGGIFAGCGPVKTRGGVNDVNLQESDMPAANNEPREERIMEIFGFGKNRCETARSY